ncbi:ImmA/IrrE family metallo-endopeptidase [Demequina sp. SO4-18]|uniref:ImmA/IrrE family metallo-endopeptidase n=1 Tax=Demequina sp. SO4-18 TaxID=3401026 RepID=UPI003B5C2373
MEKLITVAEAMGLYVGFRDLGEVNGYYLGSDLVVVNFRRSLRAQRVTLAHEIGHWHHDHDWSVSHDKARDEREANAYAARLLIRRDDYRMAEAMAGPSVAGIAEILNVTPELVRIRREDFARDAAIAEEAARLSLDLPDDLHDLPAAH